MSEEEIDDELDHIERRNAAYNKWLNKQRRLANIVYNIAHVIDFNPRPVHKIKPGWFLWKVRVMFRDGTEHKGTMQGNWYDDWSYETFQETHE